MDEKTKEQRLPTDFGSCPFRFTVLFRIREGPRIQSFFCCLRIIFKDASCPNLILLRSPHIHEEKAQSLSNGSREF